MSQQVGGIYYDVTLETGRMIEGQRKVEKSLGSLGDAGDKLEAKFTQVAAGVSAAIASIAVGALVNKLITAQRQFDVLFSSLKTMTGGVDQANRAWGKLEEFAAKTPYSLAEAVQGFTKLKALGLDPSEKAMTSFGNTASAMGKSLSQMIEAVADASTSEFERLKEFGIKAKQNGDQVSLTFQGVTTTIGNNAKEITQYLQQIGDVNFAGAMEERAKTLDGAMSNLADNFDALLRTINKGGFGAAVTNDVRTLNKELQGLNDTMLNSQKAGDGAVKQMANAAGYIAGAAAMGALNGTANLLNGTINLLTGGFFNLNENVQVLPESLKTNEQRAAELGGKLQDAEKNLAALQTKLALVPDNIYLKDSTYQAFLLVQELRAAKDAQDKLARNGQTSQSESRIKASNAFSEQVAKDKAAVSDLLTDLSGVPKKYIDTMRKIGELHASGALTGDAHTKALDGARGLLKKPTAAKKTADEKFDDAGYLARLKKNAVDALGAINVVEAEKLRENDVLLAKGSISLQTYSEAKTLIAQGAALDRKAIADKEMEDLKDNARRADEFFADQLKSADEREKRRTDARTRAKLDTLQIKAQGGSVDDKEALIRGAAGADMAGVEDQRVEAVRIGDLEGAKIYADQKVAIESEMNAKIQAMRDNANQTAMNSTADIFGSLVSITKNAAGEQSGVYQAMFAAQKAYSIASAIIAIQTGIGKAASEPWPLNLVAMASVAAATAGIVSTISGTNISGGRQYGGPANSGNLYRVNEKGAPEMFTAANGSQYMMPTQSGRVTAADQVGGANVQWVINVQNAPAGTTTSVDQTARIVTIAVAEIANQFSTNTGKAWNSLRGASNVQGRM